MSQTYTDYHTAYAAAITLARLCKHDVALRRTGNSYTISLASRNDSDHSRAEIVTPSHPFTATS